MISVLVLQALGAEDQRSGFTAVFWLLGIAVGDVAVLAATYGLVSLIGRMFGSK